MSITRTAPAPTRATSSVVLTAGLINIPLAVYTATESTSVTRKEFLSGNPDISIGRVAIRRDNDTVVDTADVTRMAQADDGTWVILTDDEIGECVGAAGGCEVVCFVPVKDADRYLTDGMYQVRPKNDKRGGAAATAAFTLLLAGMTARKVHALVKFSMRGAPRYALLAATGDLLLIATADAVRAALPMPDVKPSKAELDMVTSLIDAIGIETPTVLDDISTEVRAYVNSKAKNGGAMSAPTAIAPAPVIDLVERLQASIVAVEAAKSPAPTKARKSKVA